MANQVELFQEEHPRNNHPTVSSQLQHLNIQKLQNPRNLSERNDKDP